MSLILLIAALVFFLIAAIPIQIWKLNWIALGLAAYAAYMLVSHLVPPA